MSVIVVATDGSPAADTALSEAIDLARETHDPLAVVTVWQALQGDYGLAHPPTAVLSELLDAERDHAEATLARAAERARAAGVAVETHLLTGDPAKTICRFADEHGARLIVVGTHGYGTVMSLLMGSVSESVIRRAPCAVLVARARQEEPTSRPAPARLAQPNGTT
jgi:nucleotide-binding universal stress UspA family protein